MASLAHRKGQTLVAFVLTALLAAAAVFGPWYTQLVDRTVTTQAFALDEPGTTVRLASATVPDLAQLLPATSSHLFEAPVASRHTSVKWVDEGTTQPVEGGLTWREGICDHIRLTAGRCPESSAATPEDSTRVEVAVSAFDAERYDVGVGDLVGETGSLTEAVIFEIVGVYDVPEPGAPYWFGVIPTERSGWRDLDFPTSDLFVVAREAFETGTQRPFNDQLEVRVVPGGVDTDDVALLREDLAALRTSAAAAQVDVATDMDATFERLGRSREVSSTTMTLVLAQLGVLALVVLAMLVSLALAQRRPEIGLGRLRGQAARRLRRGLTGEWAVVVAAGTAVGGLLGTLGVVGVRAAWLPGSPALAPPWSAAAALAATAVAAVALMALMAGPVVQEPVSALLRSTGPRASAPTSSRVLLDTALVTLAAAGLLVGLQSPDDSALVLLAPSLLAVGASVLLVRALTTLAARSSRRALERGRTTTALGSVLLALSRGLRVLVTVLCLASAFAVFSAQMASVGERNRQHRAEVEAGAAAVASTTAAPSALVRALDEVDPDRELATAVVVTRRTDPTALGAMYVEPDAFPRIAFGAGEATDARGWGSIGAPSVEPVPLQGDTLSVTVQPHRLTTSDVGTSAALLEVTADYLTAGGDRLVARLGTTDLVAARAVTLRTRIRCGDGCRLLRLGLDPDGPAAGRVELTDLASGTAGQPEPVELGAAEHWEPTAAAADGTASTFGAGTWSADFDTGGSEIAVQHALLPVSLPVLLAEEHAPSAEYAGATVSTPAGEPVPLTIVATTEAAVPRVLRNVGVADLELLLRRGETLTRGSTEVQVWYSATGSARTVLDRALADAGIEVTEVETLADRTERYADSAESLTARVHPVAATLAALLAVLGLVLAVASGWRQRTRDLAALRMVGVRREVLLRATHGSHLVLVASTVLVGALCGGVGFLLAIERTPLFTTPESAIPTDLSLAPGVLLVVLALLLGALAATAVAGGRWLVGRSTLERVREAAP
ncbi:hypothetical protein GCM10027026_08240 [Myroides odoratimimus subsp. xuanwuensis]